MNELQVLADTLADDARLAANEVLVAPETGRQAMIPLERMLAFPRP